MQERIKFKRRIGNKGLRFIRTNQFIQKWEPTTYQPNLRIMGNSIENSQQPAFSFIKSIFGLSRAQTIPLCTNLGYLPYQKVGNIKLNHWHRIKGQVERNEKIEKWLRKWYNMNIRIKITQGNLYSHRFWRGIPIHGQNARTNGKTAKRLNPGRIPDNMRLRSGSTFVSVNGKAPSRIQSKKLQVQKQGVSVKGQYAKKSKKKPT